MTNYQLNIEESETSLKMIDHTMCVKAFASDLRPLHTNLCKCASCGIEEYYVKLYDAMCSNCAKHYLYNEY